MLPAYARSRNGRVFRLVRSSERLDATRMRYRLRAVPLPATDAAPLEVTHVLDADVLLDKLRLGQAIPTPESTFEDLWQRLQIDLNLGSA